MPSPTDPADGLATTAVVVAQHAGPALVLSVRGDVDSASAPGLRATMTERVGATSGPVVVDLSEVTFIGSAGLRLLMDLRELLGGRTFRLVTGGVRLIVRPLEITGLDRALRLYPDLPSALVD